MRKFILMLVLVFPGNDVLAEWTKVSSSSNGDFISYVDLATLTETDSNRVKMWVLWNYKAVQKLGDNQYSSVKYQEEFDCKEKKIQGLSSEYFFNNMGDGRAVYTRSDFGKWMPVSPESIGEGEWKIACGKLKQTKISE